MNDDECTIFETRQDICHGKIWPPTTFSESCNCIVRNQSNATLISSIGLGARFPANYFLNTFGLGLGPASFGCPWSSSDDVVAMATLADAGCCWWCGQQEMWVIPWCFACLTTLSSKNFDRPPTEWNILFEMRCRWLLDSCKLETLGNIVFQRFLSLQVVLLHGIEAFLKGAAFGARLHGSKAPWLSSWSKNL